VRRLDDRTVELDREELLLAELVSLLLDQGYSQGDAVILLRGSRVPEELRSKTPVLDEVLTPELADYLAS
jgi:hypothetical protein